jgi:predicted  nucleic acid-binding Zn-ribbon protein
LTDVPSEVSGHTVSTTGTGSPEKKKKISNSSSEYTKQQHQHQQSTSPWLSMFQKLQHQQQPQPKVVIVENNNINSQSPLKQQIHDHLHWIEDRLTAPSHVLPGLSRNSTATTTSSDSSPTRNKQQNPHHYHLQYGPAPATVSSTSSNSNSMAGGGVEVTLDSAQQMQRVQQLEHLLEQTKMQHEQDRSDWLQTLQAAANVTAKGERLSVQQQQQYQQLQKQVESATQKQKKQYKEKIRVLSELLELTEQQHDTEKTQWKQEQHELEETVSQWIADKSQLMETIETANKDIVQYQQQYQQSQNEISTLQSQLESLRQELEHVQQEKKELETNVTTLNAELEQSKSQLDKASSSNDIIQQYQTQIEQWKKEAAYFKEQAADCTEHAAAHVQQQKRKPNLSVSIPPRFPETPTVSSKSLFTTTTTTAEELLLLDEQLDRALAERDMYQQEAELLQKRLAEETKKHAAHVQEMLNRTPSHEEIKRAESDIMIKYREAVEKHGELVIRLKKIEDHRASDRGYFKLKLEAALAESRKLESEKLALEHTIQELADLHAEEIHNLELQLQQQPQQSQKFFPSPSTTSLERHRPAPERDMTNIHHFAASSFSSCTQPQCHEVKRLLELTQTENLELINRCEEFSKQLEELQTLHANASHKYERAWADRNQLKEQLDALQLQQQQQQQSGCDRNHHTTTTKEMHKEENKNVIPLDDPHSYPSGFMKILDEVRADVTCMRKALEQLTQSDRMNSSSFQGFQGDLEAIQNSLNDAVAELTLEADSLLESREMMKEVASSSQESRSKFTEQQSRILEELASLRKSVGKALNRRIPTTPQSNNAGGNNNSSSNISLELIEQLQEQAAALATAQAELRHCQEKLESEIASRQKAEFEVFSLQEQADAYEEELMDLQSNNNKLIKQLHAAGLKIDAALLARRMPTGLDDDADVGDDAFGETYTTTTPMLEDALKLAQGLTDIIHKRENPEDEPSAMEMLERMSKMMDVHESSASRTTPRNRAAASSSSSRTPTSRDRHIFDSTGEVEIVHDMDASYFSNEFPPSPVETPMPKEGTAKVTQLQLVVEQLYGRCALLERERVEMMAVTLDLLESAREANAAELEAALATARRKATEEVIRVRQQSRQEQEKIFYRLCNKCIQNGPQLLQASREC